MSSLLEDQTLIIDGEGPSSSKLNNNRSTPHVNTSIHQAKSKQDFYWAISNYDGELMIVCDGHGSDEVINRIRKFNFSQYAENIKNLNPVLIIEDLQKITNTPDTQGFKNGSRSSGSTISVVVSTDDKIKISWLGDSQVSVFKNENLYYQTKEHNYNDDSEAIHGKKLVPQHACQITEDGNMTQMSKPYIDHGYPDPKSFDICAVTRALGHGNKTYNKPDYHELTIDNKNKWKIILASDGLHDVLGATPSDKKILANKNAEELCNVAIHRWSSNYKWNFVPINYPPFQTQFKDGDGDDVVVITWDKPIS